MTAERLALRSPIETPRTRIRRFAPEDVAPFSSFMADPGSTMFLPFPEEMKTPDGAAALIEETIRLYSTSDPLLAYAIERRSDGAFIGFCGMNVVGEDAVEILYAILNGFRHQGFARETVRALCEHVFAQSAVPRVVAFVDPRNAPSLVVLRSLGFSDHGSVAHHMFREPVQRFVLRREAL